MASEAADGLRCGDPRECEAFVEAHYRGVYRFLLWLTRSPETAADLTQESFAAFWQAVRRAEHGVGTDPKAWLYGIARNRWRKRCREASRECWDPLDEAVDVAAAGPGPEASLLRQMELARMTDAVAALAPRLREALVLRVWEELEYAQIAAALMISEGLARWRVHRARQKLAALLAAMEEGAGASR